MKNVWRATSTGMMVQRHRSGRRKVDQLRFGLTAPSQWLTSTLYRPRRQTGRHLFIANLLLHPFCAPHQPRTATNTSSSQARRSPHPLSRSYVHPLPTSHMRNRTVLGDSENTSLESTIGVEERISKARGRWERTGGPHTSPAGRGRWSSKVKVVGSNGPPCTVCEKPGESGLVARRRMTRVG